MVATYGRVSPSQRFTRHNPCPICGGGDGDKRGRGIRCYGFLSDDERYAFCTNDDYAGTLPQRPNGAYKHRLEGGPCHCGDDHAAGHRVPPLRRTPSPEAPKPPSRSHLTLGDPTAIHAYGDTFRFLRYGSGKGKRLIWQHADGQGGWLDGRDGWQPRLYRQDEVRAANGRKPVFWPEGEKCVDALVAVGAVALCNPDGAGPGKYAAVAEIAREVLAGGHIVILADPDKDGRPHAQAIADGLADVAASVRIIELEGAHDVADWLADGHTLLELLELVACTPAQGVKSNIEFTTPAAETTDQPAPGDGVNYARIGLDAACKALPATYDELRAAYRTLLAQNRGMNDKLQWIWDTLAVPESMMPLGKRVLLILARRNAEWRTLTPDQLAKMTAKAREVAAKGYRPDYYKTMGEAAGMSEGTVSKNLRSLADDYGLIHIEAFREMRSSGEPDSDGKPQASDVIPRIAYSIEPAKISNHRAWIPKDGPRTKRGGARAGAGRKKICETPGCGGEEFTPERTYREVAERVVRESFCKKCGTRHREIVSDTTVGREQIADIPEMGVDVKSNIEFTPPADAREASAKSDSNVTPLPPDTDSPKNAFTPADVAPGPGANRHRERADVRRMAEALGWPRVQIAQGASTGGDPETWERFTVGNPPERIDAAYAALASLAARKEAS